MVVEADRRRATTTTWLGLGFTVALLLAANVLNNTILRSATIVAGIVEVALLAVVAVRCGLGTHGLGLSRDTWRRGARWAGISAAVVLTLYLLALALPQTRPVFLDRRGDIGLGRAVFAATVPVLFATVLLEEFAFRGVLWGLLCRLRGPRIATLGSAVLFGLWHVLPSLNLLGENQAARDALRGNPAGAVVFAVVSTTIAGLVFGALRQRSGSLLAPIGLHWATNGLGYIFSALLWWSQTR